jgi:hypothetical protein
MALDDERENGALLTSAKWSLTIAIAVDSNMRASFGFPLSKEVTALLFKAETLLAGIIIIGDGQESEI